MSVIKFSLSYKLPLTCIYCLIIVVEPQYEALLLQPFFMIIKDDCLSEWFFLLENIEKKIPGDKIYFMDL